jgi:hypothetical protein
MLHTNDIPKVRDWSDLPRVIAISKAAGAIGQAHLLQALYTGRIAFLPMLPDTSVTRFKSWARATANRPAISLVGDDDGMNRSPTGWPVADRAVRWARSILIHASGAEIYQYEAAVVAAELIQKVLIVECCSATLGAWVQLVRDAPNRPVTTVIAPKGGVHPVPMDRSKMQ